MSKFILEYYFPTQKNNTEADMAYQIVEKPTLCKRAWNFVKFAFGVIIVVAVFYILPGMYFSHNDASDASRWEKIAAPFKVATSGWGGFFVNPKPEATPEESQSEESGKEASKAQPTEGEAAQPAKAEAQPTEEATESEANTDEAPPEEPTEEAAEGQPAEPEANAEEAPPEGTTEEPTEAQPAEAEVNAEEAPPEEPAEEASEGQPAETEAKVKVDVDSEEYKAFLEWKSQQRQ